MARPRLDQVDAMRPVKQVGVIWTHVILYLAPVLTGAGPAAALLLLHVSREGFFFISACMLTYAYAGLTRAELPRFYRRRFVSVGIPYVCWNVIYFAYGLKDWHYPSLGAELAGFGRLMLTGYYQLYFLLVIMEFYLVFPLVLALLRRTRGHHGLLLAVTAAAQLAISVATHWNLLPAPLMQYAQENALSYVLYLVGGAVVACHLERVHDWVISNATLVYFLTIAAAIFAEVVYFLAYAGVTSALGSGSDPFQPSVIPFNIGAITCGYLAGVALVRPWRSARTRAAVRVGSDNAYGIYLTQMLFINILSSLGWGRLGTSVPWPVWTTLTVAIVFPCGIALTALLARTPLAVPLTGRTRQPWRTLIPRRAGAAPAPAPQPAAMAVAASDQNGA